MSPQLILLLLRLLIGLVLYIFLGSLLYLVWWDLRQARPEAVVLPQAALLFHGEDGESTIPLLMTNLIGRAPENTIVLQDETVSARHARISFAAGQWILEDLGSKNGTFVNDLPLEGELVVTYGDRIAFGTLTAIFTADRGATQPALSPEGSSDKDVIR